MKNSPTLAWKGWYVLIKKLTDGEVIKRLGPYADVRTAERTQAGVIRNLDHGRFFATVRLEEGEES